MKFDIVEINKGDVILTPLHIGNLPPEKVDKYCDKAIKSMKKVFGCRVAVLPSREKDWEFTIIRNTGKKKK